ncbi:Rid family hydrolase [Streptomyces sp. NBC_00728]|uniref:RidA family protein n=1 Tax=Streptomyces sp. NBC_00728 TaxID=2903676 RepID=UPI00386AF486
MSAPVRPTTRLTAVAPSEDDGPAAQARAVCERLARLLRERGGVPGDIVHLTEFVGVAALEARDELAAALAELLESHRPARTTVISETLPAGAHFALAARLDPGGGRSLPAGLREARDGTVVLPTVLPLDPHGDLAHPGDFPRQYAHCLRTADRLLRGAGLSLDHAVTTYDYSTPATRRAYPLCAGPRRELLGGAGVFPGAGGILMSRLHAPGVLVALDVTASRHPLTAVNPGWRRYDTLTYSPGVRAGRTLHMSGFAALDMDTQQALHAGDPAAQTHAIYRAVRTVIEAAGGGPEDLVHTQEFLCPTALAPTARADAASPAGTTATSADPWAEARAGALGPGARPAVTTAGCAALLRREFLIEVFPTAVLPASALAPGDLPEGGR